MEKTHRKTLEFASLPLVEVAVRLRPEPPTQVPHDLVQVCHLTTALHERLPVARYMEESYPSTAPFWPRRAKGLTSGLRFCNDEGLSLSILPHHMFVKWANREQLPKSPYPRFVCLEALLRWSVDRIRATLGADAIRGFSMASMSYVNFVETATASTWRDVRLYLRNEVIPPALRDDDLCNGLVLSWRDDEERDMRIEVRSVRPSVPEMPHGFELVTSSGCFFEAVSWPERELLDNHMALIKWFGDIITDMAYVKWGGQNA